MQKHRYILEKGSKKHHCPECGKKTFVRYVDTETGDYLPEQYGRCDRESKCSFHCNPYSDRYAQASEGQEYFYNVYFPENRKQPVKKHNPLTTSEFVPFDFDTFKQTLEASRYKTNGFIQNLLNNVPFPFVTDEVTKVVELYRLGTVAHGHRAGAITFPFIDQNNYVRAVQVKQFDEQNHTTGTDFLHAIIERHCTRNNKPLPEWLEAYTKQEKRVSCLFGEHLLTKYPNNPVALVEAPKTAIYGTLYFGLPETTDGLIWVAVYNKSSFSFDKIKALKGRFVYVFPDLSKDGNTYQEWETKAKEYESRLSGTRFIFSDLLERLAPDPDKYNGNDLADYLIRLDWHLFRKPDFALRPHPVAQKVTGVTKVIPQQNTVFSHDESTAGVENLKKPESKNLTIVNIQDFSKLINVPSNDWSSEIEELETFFANCPIPENLQIRGGRISDSKKFLSTSLAFVKANNGNKAYEPYLLRLFELKDQLSAIRIRA